MINVDYKTERREEARKAGKCTMCMKRKARASKGLLTCGPCSKAAGQRRDALVAERKAVLISNNDRKERATTGRTNKTRTTRTTNRMKTKV